MLKKEQMYKTFFFLIIWVYKVHITFVEYFGYWTFDFEHRTLDIGHWTLDIGHWTLDIGHLTLDI